jgi:hypothetical protein
MWYEYRCDNCGLAYETQTFTRLGRTLDDRLCECGGDLLRIASNLQCATATPEPYWNYTVGDYVTSSRDFEEKLRIGAEKMTERLGYEQHFTPVYPDEKKSYVESTASNDGANGESMERHSKLQNIVNDKRKIIT